MSRYYIGLPQQQPGNALLDFSQINSGLDSIAGANQRATQNALAERKMKMAEDQFAYQRGRDQKTDARSEVEWYGQQALAVDQMQGPQRAAAWQRIIAKHGAENLAPDELDPITGPKLMMAQAGKFVDPLDRQIKAAELDKIRALATKARHEASVAGEQYGKSGTIIQDQAGNYYSVQFGSHGQKKIEPLALGGTNLTPSRGVGTMDTGTDFRVYDKATGADVRTIGKNVADKEAQEEIGKARGKAVMDLPRVEDNAFLALKTIEAMKTHEGRRYGLGVTGVLPGIPGTQQRDFVNLVEQAKGKVFLEAFNSLRGGGQITEAEGNKATQALARLDRAQSPKGFDTALKDLEDVINLGISRARKGARGPGGPVAPEFSLPPGFKIEKVD